MGKNDLTQQEFDAIYDNSNSEHQDDSMDSNATIPVTPSASQEPNKNKSFLVGLAMTWALASGLTSCQLPESTLPLAQERILLSEEDYLKKEIADKINFIIPKLGLVAGDELVLNTIWDIITLKCRENNEVYIESRNESSMLRYEYYHNNNHNKIWMIKSIFGPDSRIGKLEEVAPDESEVTSKIARLHQHFELRQDYIELDDVLAHRKDFSEDPKYVAIFKQRKKWKDEKIHSPETPIERIRREKKELDKLIKDSDEKEAYLNYPSPPL